MDRLAYATKTLTLVCVKSILQNFQAKCLIFCPDLFDAFNKSDLVEAIV